GQYFAGLHSRAGRGARRHAGNWITWHGQYCTAQPRTVLWIAHTTRRHAVHARARIAQDRYGRDGSRHCGCSGLIRMDHTHSHHGGHAPIEKQSSGAARAEHAHHDRHAGHSVAMFRDRFWLSLALTVPVVLLSPDVATWLGYTLPDIPGLDYLPALLGTVIFFYGGLVFIRGAAGELRDRRPGMMTLISLAILVA